MLSFWENCCSQLKEELTPQQFNTWIKPLEPIEFDGRVLYISAPNRPKLDCVKTQFLARINTLAEQFWGYSVEVEITLPRKTSAYLVMKKTDEFKKTEKNEQDENFNNSISAGEPNPAYAKSGLNKALSFENFVTGKANQLAHAAAIQVSDNPGTSYNPLFIYGGVGLGKTHLIHAIGNKIIAATPSAMIRYIRADNYVNSVITAYQRKGFDDFKRYYQSLDMLLIDDIQFIGGNKTRTQEEFFYVFESLIARNKQIIITSDQQPKELSGIDKRLTSRFASGIAVHVEPPELEMRVAILQQKALQQNELISDEVAFFVAKNIRSNVRELEGALNNLLAYSKLFDIHNEKISVDVAKIALKDLLSVQNRQISIENIQKTVAEYYGIKISDMYSKQRTRKIALPRQIAMYLAKELTQKSLPEIGELFGGRDHTTVLHAVRKLQKDRNSDTKLNHDLHVLEQTLKA